MSEGSDTIIDEEAFDQALIDRQFDEAKKLLPKININAKDSQGNNHVMRACLNSDLEKLKWLLQNGANIQVYEEPSRNLLFLAIQARSLEIVKWLAIVKPEYLKDQYDGQTPLHAAILENKLDIVKVIVKAGGCLETQNKDGKSAQRLAHDKGYKDILKWLLLYKSFEILNEGIYEEVKISRLQSNFDKYGYEFLDAKSEEKNMTIAKYAASMDQIKILQWLKSKNIQVDDSLLDNINETKINYNMLLFGETGVGKSTFINAFMNYLNFNTFEEAENAKSLHCLIPTYFSIYDENLEPKTVFFGKDNNESNIPGASATQSVRSYVFAIGNVNIRLIDTPSIGGTSCINKDVEDFDRLLRVIGELKDIHGICIMLKPNTARLNVLFEYCVKQLFSNLQKDASQNIIFLFTNSRSTFYKPGDTITPLRNILEEIKSKPPNIEIPFKKKNVFCLDNEAFRFIIAKKNNIQFDENERKNFAESWTKSAKVSIDLLKYLKSLKPHKIQETISLNEARRQILRLGQPLAEITQNIQDNIRRVDRLKENLSDKSKDIDELKKFLMVPRITVETIPLDHPITVCAHISCTDYIKIEDSSYIHYRQICHDPCYLADIQEQVRGHLELLKCAAMSRIGNTAICKHASCRHDYRDHMNIHYMTKLREEETEDPNIAKKIGKNLVDIKYIENKISELSTTRQEYEGEIKAIQESIARFAHFLKNNAISAFNDTYKKYIEYLIDREEELGEDDNKDRIEILKKLIVTYENYKQILEQQLQKIQETQAGFKSMVSAEEVINIINELYKLPHSGAIIKQAALAQDQADRGGVFKNKEKVIRPVEVKGESPKSWLCRNLDLFCEIKPH